MTGTQWLELIAAVLIVLGIIFVIWHNWEGHLTNTLLSRAFFWFGMVCLIFGIFTQYASSHNLISTQAMFGDSTFYFSVAMVGLLAGIYWNTEKSNRLL